MEQIAGRPAPRATRYSPLATRYSSRLGEGQVEDLAELTAGGILTRAEIGPLGRVAGLAGPAAGVAADDPFLGGALDPAVEGIAGGHIGKSGRGRSPGAPATGGDND